MPVPFLDLQAQAAEVADEVGPLVAEVFRTCAFIGGPHVAGFEAAYASYCGVRHAIGVANGTDALELAFRAVGVRPGGEVIMPANTFIATAEAASRIGATPVLVDVDDDHLLIDPTRVEAAITDRTQAIVPVHLYGRLAPVAELRPIADAAGVPLVEDAAQSQGARTAGRSSGGLADIAATSFYPGKNLGAAGDAGAVTTDDPEWAESVRRVSQHGSLVKYVHDVVGVNSRLDAVQAVFLDAKLARLDAWNAARRRAASRYGALLADIAGVRTPADDAGEAHVWHLYVVRVAERDRVLAELGASGIGAGVHYPYPLHLTPAYAHLGLGPGAFPVAERAATEILSLPMFPHLTADQQEEVVGAVRRAVRG